MSKEIPPRQLIVCCDGTNNNLTGRRYDTNVTQLCELLDPDAQNQLLYYDPGVGNAGTLPDASAWDKLKAAFSRLSGLAFGSGIFENIEQAYLFLMRNWRPGDQVFLYGFSRGAFTARSVGGLVTQFGILRPEMEAMVPTLLHFYFLNRTRQKRSFDLIKTQISQMFAGDAARQAKVHFVGVWDTVASVGAPMIGKKITASPTIVNKRFSHVRQALALDEYRTTFEPRPYVIEAGYPYDAHQQSIRQAWFAGSHCDVGGGYDNGDAGLSQQALLWMLTESVALPCALRLRQGLLTAQGGLDVSAVQTLLNQRSESSAHRHTMVHSETYDTPWWALGGMTLRNPAKPPDLPNVALVPPEESPTVAQNKLMFPQDSQWQLPRSMPKLLLAATLGFVLWVSMGALLIGPSDLAGDGLLAKFSAALSSLPAVADANCSFTRWQLGWWVSWQTLGVPLTHFHSPRAAVLLDFLFITAYGYLLARATGWAFARLAGLRRVAFKTAPWLNLLGMGACAMVVGDLAENVLTLTVLTTSPSEFVPWLDMLLGALMSLACAVKWAGLSLSLVLFLAGWLLPQWLRPKPI